MISSLDPKYCPDCEFLPELNSLFDSILNNLDLVWNEKMPDASITSSNEILPMEVSVTPLLTIIRKAAKFEINPYTITDLTVLADYVQATHKQDDRGVQEVCKALVAPFHELMNLIEPAVRTRSHLGTSFTCFKEATVVAQWRLERGN
jgi:hypothetical protein